jgi:succinate dehydrogenase/fumarate reductase cytochrome b subunit
LAANQRARRFRYSRCAVLVSLGVWPPPGFSLPAQPSARPKASSRAGAHFCGRRSRRRKARQPIVGHWRRTGTMMAAMTAAETPGERAFRACGIAPLGVFALLHVLLYARVLVGQRRFGDADAIRLSPWVVAVELVLVTGPLAFHALYGLYLLARRPPRPAAGSTRTLDRVQRATSLLVLAFIVDHYARFRWPLLGGAAVPSDAYDLLVRELSSTSSGLPLIAGFHLLGIAALAFHLGYGLYRFQWRGSWLEAERRRVWLAVGVGLLVLILASLAVLELATGKVALVPGGT